MQQHESYWVQQAQQGDRKAFEQLYRANVGKVNALCMRLCGHRELAEDLVQDSFIQAWQKIGSFRGESAFGSWMYRLTSNVVIGYLRSQAKWKMVNFDIQEHESILGFSSIESSHPEIEKALSKLPDQARVVVILHEYLGYKHEEISRLTGMAVGTSKSHLHRAKGMLKQRAAA